MAAKFKKGSIVDIVNSPNKTTPKKKKKSKIEELQEVVIVDSNEESAQPKEETVPVVSGKKRKITADKNDSIESVPEVAESSGKKKQKKRKSKSVSETEVNVETEETSADAETVSQETDEAKREKLSKTLFIGNLPSNFSLKNLKKITAQYGSVASIRVRSVAPAKQTLSKKAAFLSKQINPNKKTVNAYVVFRVVDSVQKAVELNGTNFEGNVIQVDKVEGTRTYENTLSIFLGNLSFKTTDNDLREFFKDCGEISNIRVIRDSKTGIGKGFGYVTFKLKDGVVLALEKDGQTFLGREIRVKTYHYTPTSKPSTKKGKKDRKNRNKFQKQSKSPVSPLKVNNKEKQSNNKVSPVKERKEQPATVKTEFKGEMSSKKNLTKKTMKNRIKSNKLNKQKKKIAEILGK